MRCLAFVWVSLVFLYIWYKYIYKYKLLYIAFWAIAACLWVPTLPKRFLFSVWISWWIHSCFCLMKANSCNMQELWPGNKNYCTCASCVLLTGSYIPGSDQGLSSQSQSSCWNLNDWLAPVRKHIVALIKSTYTRIYSFVEFLYIYLPCAFSLTYMVTGDKILI